jgi:tRNA(adenine34) deaminase
MSEEYMKIALEEAKKAYKKEEVPIGAVIVKDGKVIAKAYNLREKKKQACAHAEILAIQKACRKLRAWRLEGCEMYVTLEPCPMCAGAIMNARIKKIYIGAMEPKFGSVGSKINLLEDVVFNHTVEVEKGICEAESVKLLQDFFKELRARKKK